MVIPREVRSAPVKVDAAGPVVPIDSFVVNLQPENGQTYLQVNMSLNMTDAAGEELAKARMAEIRSRILMLISDKKPSELVTSANMQRLADEVVATLNEPLSGGVTLNVVSIFFTSFVLEQ